MVPNDWTSGHPSERCASANAPDSEGEDYKLGIGEIIFNSHPLSKNMLS